MFGLIGRLTWLLVRSVLYLIFYLTPLVGLWVASSLAAYLGAPHWMAWTAGALLFPIIPGLWELHALANRRVGSTPFFTPIDRISMRTFVVGLAFLAGLLYFYPQTAFVAISTRGDWMLEGVKDQRAQTARGILFASAGGLEWLYRATRNNPFKSHIDEKARQRADEAAKQAAQDLAKQRDQEAVQKQQQESDQKQQEETAQTQQQEPPQEQKQETENEHQQETAQPANQWPWRETTLHPAVAAMPESVETSIESVAKYIAKQERDPVLRIKALHDYVADRIAYDSDAFYSGAYPRQDAEAVFTSRKAVCAGYANLLSALATAVNEQIVVVCGDARDMTTGDKLTGSGHAWNAARIDGHWYLIDSCWDAGSVSRDKGFTKSYTTDYLLPPPAVMIQDHFPEETTWQLLATPLSQGEFLRQPMLRPRFQSAGLTLVAPQRAQNETGSTAVAIVKNPKNEWLMAGLERDGKEIGYATTPTNSELAQLEYPLPDKGKYRLNMFVNEQTKAGRYNFVGSVDFVNR